MQDSVSNWHSQWADPGSHCLCPWSRQRKDLADPTHKGDFHPTGMGIGCGTANPSPDKKCYHRFLTATSNTRHLKQDTVCYPGNLCLKTSTSCIQAKESCFTRLYFNSCLVLFSNRIGQIVKFWSLLSFLFQSWHTGFVRKWLMKEWFRDSRQHKASLKVEFYWSRAK